MNKKIKDKISQCRNQLLQVTEAARCTIKDFMLDVKAQGFDAVRLIGVPYYEDILEGLVYQDDGQLYVHFVSNGDDYGEHETLGLEDIDANELYEILCCLLYFEYKMFNK